MLFFGLVDARHFKKQEKQEKRVEKETRKTNYVRAPRKHQLQCSYLDHR
jgi:hypothetical protein